MAVEGAFLAHVLELFSEVGPLRTARMFSGVGIYAEDDAMFAMISGDGTVFMKADAITRPTFLQAGATPFSYERSGKVTEIQSLMSLPESALDSLDDALHWARLALPPARASAQEKHRQKARRQKQ